MQQQEEQSREVWDKGLECHTIHLHCKRGPVSGLEACSYSIGGRKQGGDRYVGGLETDKTRHQSKIKHNTINYQTNN